MDDQQFIEVKKNLIRDVMAKFQVEINAIIEKHKAETEQVVNAGSADELSNIRQKLK